MGLQRGRQKNRQKRPTGRKTDVQRQFKKGTKQAQDKKARGQASLTRTAAEVVEAVKKCMQDDTSVSEREAIRRECGGASYSTVKRWMHALPKSKPGPDTFLGREREQRLVDLIVQCADLGHPVNMQQVRAWVCLCLCICAIVRV